MRQNQPQACRPDISFVRAGTAALAREGGLYQSAAYEVRAAPARSVAMVVAAQGSMRHVLPCFDDLRFKARARLPNP